VVELEQVTTLLAGLDPLWHWSAVEPEPVRQVLDALRLIAPEPIRREERTLAELEQLAIDNDPVRCLERELRHLRQLASREITGAEREALTSKIRTTQVELRDARQSSRFDRVFDKYLPPPETAERLDRRATVVFDTLTAPPEWVASHVRHLHDTGQLGAVRLDDLARQLVGAAVHVDQHGHPPSAWPAVERQTIGQAHAEAPAPGIELSMS